MHAATLALLLSPFLRAASVHVVEHHSTWRTSLAAGVLALIVPADLNRGVIHDSTTHRAVCSLLACLCFVLDRGGRDPGALWWALLQLAMLSDRATCRD